MTQHYVVAQPPLVRAVLVSYRLPLAGVHGPAHWLRVLVNGHALAALTPDADAEVVGLFALLHDSHRVNEHRDPQHGERAADFVRQLASQGLLPIEGPRITVLAAASLGTNSARSPTIRPLAAAGTRTGWSYRGCIDGQSRSC